MKTYKSLPKKYRSLKGGEMTIIEGYAYAIHYPRYTGQRNIVYRISETEYNRLREDAKHWPICMANPGDETVLQMEIWAYVTDQPELAYCQTEIVY